VRRKKAGGRRPDPGSGTGNESDLAAKFLKHPDLSMRSADMSPLKFCGFFRSPQGMIQA
jgi:hypothetical protein